MNKSEILNPNEIRQAGGTDVKSIQKISLKKIKLTNNEKHISPRGLGGNDS